MGFFFIIYYYYLLLFKVSSGVYPASVLATVCNQHKFMLPVLAVCAIAVMLISNLVHLRFCDALWHSCLFSVSN